MMEVETILSSSAQGFKESYQALANKRYRLTHFTVTADGHGGMRWAGVLERPEPIPISAYDIELEETP